MKYHKLKIQVLFRKCGVLDGARDLLKKLGFKIDDITDTAHLRLTKDQEVDLNLLELRLEMTKFKNPFQMTKQLCYLGETILREAGTQHLYKVCQSAYKVEVALMN